MAKLYLIALSCSSKQHSSVHDCNNEELFNIFDSGTPLHLASFVIATSNYYKLN